MLALREKYTESVNMKEGLRQECETLELKSERAKSNPNPNPNPN